jgi:LacI family transcriptional regulator
MTPPRNDRSDERGPGSAESTMTSHDVARAAGVSQSTVSRALRGDNRVSAATRSHVREIAERLGYVPSTIGRNLATRSTRTLGIVVTDLSSVFYPQVIAPLHDEVTARGYRMVLFTEEIGSHTLAGEEAPTPLADRLLDRSIDGAVLTTSDLDGGLARHLARRGLPIVFLTRYGDDVSADAAVVDNSLGASLSAAEAIRLGHTRIGAIFGPPNTSTGRDRERGVQAALRAAGFSLSSDLTQHGPFTFESGFRSMNKLLSVSPRPTVVICANDTVAIGAFDAARSQGVAVPDDVSLIGFDDLPMAAWQSFQLTTVYQPMEEMARSAIRLLIERIEGAVAPGAVRRVVFEPSLVLRHTLAAPAPQRGA